MNPLQEKLNEMIEFYRENFYTMDNFEEELTALVNLTLEEAKKAVADDWKQWGKDGEILAYQKCRQQTLEALDKMKLTE